MQIKYSLKLLKIKYLLKGTPINCGLNPSNHHFIGARLLLNRLQTSEPPVARHFVGEQVAVEGFILILY